MGTLEDVFSLRQSDYTSELIIDKGNYGIYLIIYLR